MNDIVAFFWHSALFFDSICNDICSHLLACFVEESSLEAACRIIAEQAARAAEELVQHDLATSVLQAGPTSAARSLEIASRERAARQAVGTPKEEDAFEALRSVLVSEARRINGLMYCARLRCGIMPT